MTDEQWLEIPWQKLSGAALSGMLEDLASRDGTDYGGTELELQAKVRQLRQSLKDGSAKVVWCRETDTWSILPSEQLRR